VKLQGRRLWSLSGNSFFDMGKWNSRVFGRTWSNAVTIDRVNDTGIYVGMTSGIV
jgi:hypothetical protein